MAILATEVGAGSQRSVQPGGLASIFTLTIPGTVTAGNFLVGGGYAYRSGGATGSWTVTDSLGTVYTVLVGAADPIASGSQLVFLFYGTAPVDGACTITVRPSNGVAHYFGFAADEYTPAAVDVVGADFDSGSAPGPGAGAEISTVTANDVVIAIWGFGGIDDPTTVTAPAVALGMSDGAGGAISFCLAARTATIAGLYDVLFTTPTPKQWVAKAIALRGVMVVGPVPIAPPPGAQIPCSPTSQTGNGGKGAAGCNAGGIGSIPSYTGAWGTVPQHPNPPEHESLTGKDGQTVEAWIEVIHVDYPSGTPETILRAHVPLADDATYEGGYKTDGLNAVGDIEHALGNEQGGFEATTVNIELSDVRGNTFRDLAVDQDVGGDELYVKLASDAARAAGTSPLIAMRAIVQQLRLQSAKQVFLDGVDAIFSEFGIFGPDSRFPGRTYGELGRGAPQMTSDTKQTPIVPLYGEKTDAGAKDPVTGQLTPKGLITGVYLGKFAIDGLPQPPATTGKTLAQVVAELQASVDAGTTDADWGSIIGHSDAAALQALGTVPDTYDRLAAVIGYSDLDYLLSQGTTPAPVDNEWGILAFGFGPWYQFTGILGSDLGNGDPQQAPKRVELDIAARSGSDLLVPGFDPCPWTTFQITNPDTGEVFDLAAIGVRGALLEDHLAGKVNIAANGIGLMGLNGLPIMGVFDAIQHCLENFFYKNKTAGPWVDNSTAPQYADGTYQVNSDSFAARQAYTAQALGNGGLKVSWYPDTVKAKTQWMAELQTWTESKFGFDRHGRLSAFGLDETLDTSTWPRLDQAVDVFGPIQIRFGEGRESVSTGRCDWDADASAFRSEPLTEKNTVAIAKFKGKEKPGGQPIENPLLADERHLAWLLQRRVARLGSGMTVIEMTGRRHWLDAAYDVGQGVLLTAEDGPGPDGYEDRPCIVLRRRFNFKTQLVTLTLLDVYDALLSTRFVNGLTRLSVVTDTDAAAPVVTDDADVAALVLI